MQVVLSVLYMLHNALFSCMMVASEWSGFITERKTLRVSSPTGIQRSSYFISMPLRYGIPVMVLFTTEHWLLSQSYFIIRLIRNDWTGTPSKEWTISGASIAPYILGKSLRLFWRNTLSPISHDASFSDGTCSITPWLHAEILRWTQHATCINMQRRY